MRKKLKPTLPLIAVSHLPGYPPTSNKELVIPHENAVMIFRELDAKKIGFDINGLPKYPVKGKLYNRVIDIFIKLQFMKDKIKDRKEKKFFEREIFLYLKYFKSFLKNFQNDRLIVPEINIEEEQGEVPEEKEK